MAIYFLLHWGSFSCLRPQRGLITTDFSRSSAVQTSLSEVENALLEIAIVVVVRFLFFFSRPEVRYIIHLIVLSVSKVMIAPLKPP